MDKYAEVNLRHCQDESRIRFLESLKVKVNNIFDPVRNTAWNNDYAPSYRFDFDHVASEVYELLQYNGNEDLLECIMVFMALCFGKDKTYTSSYLSFIDLIDALRISNQHIIILESREKTMQEQASREESAQHHSESCSQCCPDASAHTVQIAQRRRNQRNAFNHVWQKKGIQIPPRGVTFTRNPDIYRVQISLSKGRRVSHNVPGLENALFLYDVMLHFSESFNRDSLIDVGNYYCLKSLNMVEDEQNYSQKLFEKAQQFSSVMQVLTIEDVERIELRYVTRT
jgi:hypothetical protein